MAKTGNLSINSENMLPIIKKWLYSDHDIFVREQVANACDAVTKLKSLKASASITRKRGISMKCTWSSIPMKRR